MPAKRTGRQYDNLKKNVKALFEEAGDVVKKSTQPTTKPAAKPSPRPTDQPSEKPFTAMLSQKAQDILEQEEERTGENLPLILERAIINLKTPVANDVGVVAAKKKQPAVSITDEDNYKLQVLNRIVNLSFDEIAGRFNKEGLITFSGKGQWHGITISAMYKRFKDS
jgi:hypothetical protein